METTQHYFCPQKHVLLVKDSEIGNNQITCQICESSVTAPFYVCHTCKYYVHKSCVIKELNHPFHPRHPLSLRQRYYVGCNSCGRYFGMSLMFSCVKCNFDLDVDCALMSNSIITCPEGQNCIQHSTHPHLLLLVDTTDHAIYKNIHARCFVCQSEDSPSDDRVYYGCKRCKYFLHQQCIDQFPQQIQTSLHPNHGCLSLRFKRVLNYKYHDHPLSFVKNMSSAFEIEECNVYDTCFKTSVMSSSKEFQKTESFKLWCCDCDFQLHLLCGPLPSTIKHEVKLKEIHEYIAHVYCVISEVKDTYNVFP
ncbi:hypothetical protein F8388_019088 [Cannabis sativa]|uniref:DC1 domain-containing protein n=1 Tax=Cannabis sativa TaxID=3483 RepID=A0A7J6FCE9_CANSA|nr:hypothetical protein F8388_019088 [Cannabis sativa]